MSNFAKQWAERLNGREYGDEMDRREAQQAKADGVLIVFGASDDLIEFRGIINDEVGCYGTGKVLFTPDGPLEAHRDCECQYCGYKERVKSAFVLDAKWDKGGYSWLLETDLPHETFEILEDGETYCRGLVIDGSALTPPASEDGR